MTIVGVIFRFLQDSKTNRIPTIADAMKDKTMK
jgi:hypothetical protein